jgi:primase-polymerase (primpol)-like protein
MSILQQKIPPELIALPQWVLWGTLPRDGKPTKVPFQARQRLQMAKVNDHRTWATFDLAMEMWQQWHRETVRGLGFVFTADDPYCGIDVDNCFPSDAAGAAPWAEGLLGRFSDTYGEVSPSGKGIKFWVKAKLPRQGSRWPVENGAVEAYDRLRFFAVTGQSNGMLTITDHQADVEQLVEHLDRHRATTLSHPANSGARMASGPIPKGQRHPTLLSRAGTMWKWGMSPEAIEAALLDVNQRQCDPPYPPAHIHKMVLTMPRWSR